MNRMVVRACYVSLADKVLNGVTKISLVLGIKGIGKTVFMNYLIVRIVEKYRALGEVVPNIVYTWKSDVTERMLFSVHGVMTLLTSTLAPHYLSDSVDIADASWGTELLLEVSSYDSNNYGKFEDRMAEGGMGAYEYHLPAWGLDELLIVHPISETHSKEDAIFLFMVFGGSVRYSSPGGGLSLSCEDYIQRSALWFFGPDIQRKNPSIWCWAMHVIRMRMNMLEASAGKLTADRVAVGSLFVDPHISVEGTGYYIVGHTSRFMRFLAGCIRDDAETTLWNPFKDIIGGGGEGVAFESLGHKTLVATDQEYVAENMNSKARRNKTFTKSFYQMPRVLIRSVDGIEQLKDDQYGLPLFCNFALVDVVIQPNLLLQFTIGKTHGQASDVGKYAALRSQLRGAMETHKLIFVVRLDNLEEFKAVGIPEDLM